jgi:hypothetical protein
MSVIVIINETNLPQDKELNNLVISEKDMDIIVKASQVLVDEHSKTWNVSDIKILSVTKNVVMSEKQCIKNLGLKLADIFGFITVENNTGDDTTIMGYHSTVRTNMGDIPYGKIYSVNCLNSAEEKTVKYENASGIFDNYKTVKNLELYQEHSPFVSKVLCHEILEMLSDPSGYLSTLNGEEVTVPNKYGLQQSIAIEIVDPVNYNIVPVEVFTSETESCIVMMSDFVYPSWFRKYGKPPYNYVDTLKAPFALDYGGYVSFLED